MNSVARLVESSPELAPIGGGDKEIQKLERLRKKFRKHESNLRATIAELAAMGAHVNARHGNQTFEIAQVEFTFNRLK